MEESSQLVGDTSKRRIFAYAVDNLCGGAVAYAAVAALIVIGLDDPATIAVVFTLAYFGFFVCCESLWARTPGKALFDLHICRLDGTTPGFQEACLRGMLRLIEANPLLLGGLPAGVAVSLSKQRQRLGDRLARTVVVRGKLLPRRSDVEKDLAEQFS